MFWNYRVLREDHPYGDGEIDTTHTIVEAYYEDGETVPHAHAEASLYSIEGVDGLQWTLDKFAQALERPVLVLRNGKLEEE